MAEEWVIGVLEQSEESEMNKRWDWAHATNLL